MTPARVPERRIERCQLETCGAPFEQTRPWQKYCSRPCRREAMSQRTGRRALYLTPEQISVLDAVERAAHARAAELAAQVTAMQSPAAEATKIDEEVKRSA